MAPLAGQRILAADFTAAVVAYDDTVISAGIAGSFFSGAPGLQTTFVAPTSGTVLIATSCFADIGAITSAATMIATYRLGTSAGASDVQGETLFERSARYSVFTTTQSWVGGSMGWARPTGLTAGVTYHVEWRGQQPSASGGLLSVRGRKLVIVPVQ